MIAAALVSFLYGGLVLIGGFIGYRKAGSRPSLIAGAASDTLLVLAAVLILLRRPAGIWLAIGVSGALFIFFAIRWLKGRKFMPAGLMVLASLAALGLLILLR
jgi:uncharacterized membrane protein (UPF0136 family)